MSQGHRLHYGIIGEGQDATITAYGSGIGVGIPDTEQKAWACSTCTFWNAESMGRFCSMCGSRRFFGNSENDYPPQAQAQSQPQNDGREESTFRSTRNDNHNDHGDILHFSPIAEEKRKISSLRNDRPPSIAESPPLEQSFSVMGLLNSSQEGLQSGDSNVHSTKSTPKGKLNEKDFQMSFANWSVSDQGGWTCHACTFVNTNPLHLQCEVCGQNRPPRNSQNANQKVMQEIMETSFRTGQHDFLRKQQEKIEEIEERVIISKRMEEIAEMQAGMLDDFYDEKKETNNTSRTDNTDLMERVRRTEDYIGDLERTQQQENEEQRRMQEMLSERRRQVEMDQRRPSFASAPGQPPSVPQRNQIAAQERLLSQWQQSSREQYSKIAAIRERQQQIMDRWHGGHLE